MPALRPLRSRTMKRCAGILLCTERDRRCLFLLRDDGRWDLPGGHAEPDDGSPLDTALRELSEETGYRSALTLARNRLRVSWCPDMLLGHFWKDCRTRYTGFVGYVPKEFAPVLDREHTAWRWAPANRPPEPLLPGVEFMLRWAEELDLL